MDSQSETRRTEQGQDTKDEQHLCWQRRLIQHSTAQTRKKRINQRQDEKHLTQRNRKISADKEDWHHTPRICRRVRGEGEKRRKREEERKTHTQRERWRLTGAMVSHEAGRTFTRFSGCVTDPIATPTTGQYFSERERERERGEGWQGNKQG